MKRLTSGEISENYRRCYELTASLLSQRIREQGFEIAAGNPDFIDLCQSVLGHERMVLLLQHHPFRAALYKPLLDQTIAEVRKTFFLEVAKKRFLALDALEGGGLCDEQPWESEVSEPHGDQGETLEVLRGMLTEPTFRYLKEILLPKLPCLPLNLKILLRKGKSNPPAGYIGKVEEKIRLLQRFYPDGNISGTANIVGLASLTETEIVRIYLNVYLGIERAFPANFLQRDSHRRAAILVRFLVEEILQTTPEAILAEHDETFFIRHRLQNVYRLFNYSVNRALRNAYPEVIPPWLHSRSSARYWETEEHRLEAIRWLIEERLKLSCKSFYKAAISKSVFAENGLSYMFNCYYNSVSKAIAAAYPHLEPWEIGKVPFDYWTDENSARAVRWIVVRKGWRREELPEKVQSREFNRKTFSEFGLATLFEKKFARNIYRAVSAAWPGYFEPWEFGRVSSAYWRSRQNVYRASRWIAAKEGIPESDIVPAIRKNRLTAKILHKYSIGPVLRKFCNGRIERIFAPFFWREHKIYLQEHKLLRKISALKKAQRKTSLLHYLGYGFFFHDVQLNAMETLNRYHRIARRIHQRSITNMD